MALLFHCPFVRWMFFWLCVVELSRAQENQTPGSEPFSLLEAVRKIGEESTNFTVFYKTNQPADVAIKWTDGDPEKSNLLKSEQAQDMPVGIHNTTITLASEEPKVVLSIRIEKLTYIIHMDTSGLNLSSIQQTLELAPSITLDPPGDIVYRDWDTHQFKVIASPAVEKEVIGLPAVLQIDLYAYRAQRRDFKIYKGDGDKEFTFTNIKNDGNRFTADVKFNSRHSSFSGYADFRKTVTDDIGDGMVKEIEVIKEVVIHPSDQPGIFPPSAFDLRTSADKEDRSRQFCQFNQPCQVSCFAMGNVSSLILHRLYKDGRRQHLDFEQFDVYGNYAKTGRVNAKLQSCETFQEREMKFQCTAGSKYGFGIQASFTVTYYMPIRIVKEETGLVWLNDHELEATCVAEGHLPLEIYFLAAYPGMEQYYKPNITNNDSENKSQAAAVIFSTEDQCLDLEKVMGIASKVHCYAYSSERRFNKANYTMETPAKMKRDTQL